MFVSHVRVNALKDNVGKGIILTHVQTAVLLLSFYKMEYVFYLIPVKKVKIFNLNFYYFLIVAVLAANNPTNTINECQDSCPGLLVADVSKLCTDCHSTCKPGYCTIGNSSSKCTDCSDSTHIILNGYCLPCHSSCSAN